MLPLVLVDTEDTHVCQAGRITLGQVPARAEGQGVDGVPAQAQRAGAGFHTHLVDGHALEDPPGHPVGDRGVKSF